MAWTDPKTWTVGEKIRAADLNAQLRDNMLFLYETPQIALRLTSALSVPSATDTTIVWPTPVWGTSAMWDPGGPSVVVAPRAGVYSIVLQVLWSSSSDGANLKRAAFMSVNGQRRRGTQILSTSPSEFQLAAETNLADGDELTFEVRQTSGETLELEPLRTLLTVRWVSAPPVDWTDPSSPADPLGGDVS